MLRYWHQKATFSNNKGHKSKRIKAQELLKMLLKPSYIYHLYHAQIMSQVSFTLKLKHTLGNG